MGNRNGQVDLPEKFPKLDFLNKCDKPNSNEFHLCHNRYWNFCGNNYCCLCKKIQGKNTYTRDKS